jgi:hypothetical protein
MAESEVVKRFLKTTKPPVVFGRRSLRSPVSAGAVRGPLGAYGSRMFRGRNVDKQANEERQVLQSPVFQRYLQQQTIRTPTVDWLKRYGPATR